MKVITKYEANDGSEWHSEQEALNRDRLIIRVEVAMQELKDHPTDCNWDGYVQHNTISIIRCKEKLYALADVDGVLKWWLDRQRDEHSMTNKELIEDTDPGWFNRILDGGHAPLSKAYCRLLCIDKKNREWNQPYYVFHPDEGKNICVG